MAFLKDLIVNGSARILGKIYASEFVGNATSATNASTATYATNAGTANYAKYIANEADIDFGDLDG